MNSVQFLKEKKKFSSNIFKQTAKKNCKIKWSSRCIKKKFRTSQFIVLYFKKFWYAPIENLSEDRFKSLWIIVCCCCRCCCGKTRQKEFHCKLHHSSKRASIKYQRKVTTTKAKLAATASSLPLVCEKP